VGRGTSERSVNFPGGGRNGLKDGRRGRPAKYPASPHPGLRIALAQLDLEDGDLARNMELAEHAVRAALPHRPDFLCLPEAADFGWLHQQARRDALAIPGPYTDLLASLARRHGIWISAGCLEKDGDQVYNAAVILDRGGRLVHKHRKIKTLPELTSHIYDPGPRDTPTTMETEFGRLALTICADNFDITIPQEAAKAGAWLLIAPHGFAAEIERMETNAQEFADHIRRVATGTGLWVAAANVARGLVKGGAWKGQMHCGRSRVVRPDGTEAAAGEFNLPDLVLCDIPSG
jgi:N-carbamoylputrescine amidase